MVSQLLKMFRQFEKITITWITLVTFYTTEARSNIFLRSATRHTLGAAQPKPHKLQKSVGNFQHVCLHGLFVGNFQHVCFNICVRMACDSLLKTSLTAS